MNQFWKVMDKLTQYASALLLALMCLFIFLQVVYRFILNDSRPWTEEFARYTFMWLTYCGAALAVRNGSHLRMDFLLTFAKGMSRQALMIFSDLCMALYCLLGAILGAKLLMEVVEMDQMFLSLAIPLWGVYLGIPLFFSLCFLQTIRKIFANN